MFVYIATRLMTLLATDVGYAVHHRRQLPGGDGLLRSGLAVSNVAADRPAFSGRFNTGNEESALLARGFKYGTAANAVVIGWNGGHTAVTLPTALPSPAVRVAASRIGGGGAYQGQFSHHMYLPRRRCPGRCGAVLATVAFAPDPPPTPAGSGRCAPRRRTPPRRWHRRRAGRAQDGPPPPPRAGRSDRKPLAIASEPAGQIVLVESEHLARRRDVPSRFVGAVQILGHRARGPCGHRFACQGVHLFDDDRVRRP